MVFYIIAKYFLHLYTPVYIWLHVVVTSFKNRVYIIVKYGHYFTVKFVSEAVYSPGEDMFSPVKDVHLYQAVSIC
jgi:hypothetical protein